MSPLLKHRLLTPMIRIEVNYFGKCSLMRALAYWCILMTKMMKMIVSRIANAGVMEMVKSIQSKMV